MDQLIIEMALYLGAAALIGLLLGFAVWGWGRTKKLEQARVEGAALARTSVDGSSAASEQLAEKSVEIERLQREVQSLRHRLEAREAKRELLLEHKEPEPEPVDMRLVDREPKEGSDDSEEGNASEKDEPRSSAIDEDRAAEAGKDDVIASLKEAFGADKSEVFQLEVAKSPEAPQSELHEDADDLTLIRGIDAKMAATLNETGVYNYRELASLTPSDVEWLTAEIKIPPGRIDREDWIGQAKLLDIETYGQQNYN